MLRRAYNPNGALRAWRMAVKDETGAVLFCIEAPSGLHFTSEFAR